ncbi:MAG TPA: hypothetical protein VMV71_00035 [Candidatus Paceibacterota bacterium]|nr:hypothetical protein [Candidatus Paceibacterota bacterium]
MKKLFFSALLGVSNVGVALADGGPIGTGIPVQLQNPLGSQSFADVVTAIWGALFTLSIPIVSIMVMVGGYYILTAAGNEENLRKGRQTITYAAIGFAVILLAGGVVTLVRSLFGI